MKSDEIRKKFLAFFKKRGHTVVPSSSLIPDDPSVLLTTAGMQQFKPYFTGEADPIKDFGGKNTVSVQKSFRTSDIDEVGDETHLTFFEMLGNFSFGDYFKAEAIMWAHEFITKELGLTIDYVTIFGGSDRAGEKIPVDDESEKIWQSLGVTDIHTAGLEDNFWGPTGSEGPCGPTTEIYVGGTEIWNIVFNEFFFPGTREELLGGAQDKKLRPLDTPGVDTGMGLERLAMVVQRKEREVSTIFEIDLFEPLISLFPETWDSRKKRIAADHTRAISFLISDGVRPSNKEAGYVLRRLMRRLILFEGMDMKALLNAIVKSHGDFYPELNQDTIFAVFGEEKIKFEKALKCGLKELERLGSIDAVSAFRLYESFGLPFEVIKEVGGERTKDLRREDFEKEFKKHQEKSKRGQEKKFGGHGLILNTGELKAANDEEVKKVTRLHTATHLLQAALRQILGPDVRQMGSDITAERTRFDLTSERKLTVEELQNIEDLINDVIQKDLSVIMKEMDFDEAVKLGALSFFKLKYPKRVKVYSIGGGDQVFSRELCGGPHVRHTGEIGHFKIIKEEAVAAGVRRIRAIVEP